jgi:hypothetical protein
MSFAGIGVPARRDLRFDVDEAEAIMLAVASGALDVPDLTAALERHATSR